MTHIRFAQLASMVAVIALSVVMTTPVTAASAAASTGTTTRVSLTASGTQANGDSGDGAMSADGRYVAFSSSATDLVAGDTNGRSDVFLRDRETAATTRVSVSTGGTQANGDSGGVAISADGRYVAFSSSATNLVAGDTNGAGDVFVRDRETGTTTRLSVATNGAEADEGSGVGGISADGRYVTFFSYADNLVGGDTNGADVFLRDREAGTTTRVSVATNGTQANGDSGAGAISANGRYVAFSSSATNLVAGDTNGAGDVFVRDRETGATTRVSVATNGAQGDQGSGAGAISANGRYVAFGSSATNLVAGDTNGAGDVFVRDRETGATTRVSVATSGAQGDQISFGASISGDGRYVAFSSHATNLVAGDTNDEPDVFVHDRDTGTTARVSVRSDGTQPSSVNGEGSTGPAISANGRYVAFDSRADLVAGEFPGDGDVFVHDRETGATTRVSVATNGTRAGAACYLTSISANGRYISFYTPSDELVPGDTNRSRDVFVRDQLPPATPFGDFNQDGWSDLITRQTSTGSLYLYPGKGTTFAARVRIGTGWNGMSAITRLGDFTRDGHEDLIAAQSASGALLLYPGSGTSGFAAPVKIGRAGWNGMREITAIGDLDGDGYPDLLAVQTSTGYLYLYPGHGTSLGTRRQIGPGWNAMSEVAGVGDFTRDGHVDLVARRNATGELWLYPGRTGGGFAAPIRVGNGGWNGMRALVGIGDFDRDGYTDLIAVQTSNGNLYLYPGHGTSLAARVLVGASWTTTYAPLL